MTGSRYTTTALALLLGACAGGGEEILELNVQHSVEVDFLDTAAGSPEQAIVIFDDLPENSEYQTTAGQLVCAGLDLHGSRIAFTTLKTEAPELYVDLSLEVASVGLDNWRELGAFIGTPSEGAVIPFSDGRFAMDSNGIKTLTEILNSDVPVYRIRATGKTSDSTAAMSVELTLRSVLSSHPSTCPQGVVAPSASKPVVLGHGVTVDFDSMESGESEAATISLGDLRAEPGFSAVHAELSCASIDKQGSSIRVMQLDGSDNNFRLDIQFRRIGMEDWTTLATYQGTLSPGLVAGFDSPSLVSSFEGLEALASHAASDTPNFELRFQAVSSNPIPDLELDVVIGLVFGTNATGCETGL